MNRNSPESSLVGFFVALSAHRLKEARSYVLGAQDSADVDQMFGHFPLVNAHVLSKAQTDEEAILRYCLEHEPPGRRFTVKLVCFRGEWLLTEYQESEEDFDFSWFTQPKRFRTIRRRHFEKAQAAVCSSNIQMLATATLELVRLNDNRFVFESTSWLSTVQPHIREIEPTCPLSRLPDDYAINPVLCGLEFIKIRFVRNFVFLYEGSDCELEFRHAGKASVAFLIGGSKLVNRSEAAQLIWDLV